MSGALVQAFAAPLTMSSKELADLVDKEHAAVKVSIERLADRGLVTFSSTTNKSTEGRPVVYHVNQRDSYVVAQLAPEFTARVVGRSGNWGVQRVMPTPLESIGGVSEHC